MHEQIQTFNYRILLEPNAWYCVDNDVRLICRVNWSAYLKRTIIKWYSRFLSCQIIKNECLLTRIADSRYRFSRDDMAISFNALSDRMPSQLKKFRNSFNALLNWRWKNDDFASWSLKKNHWSWVATRKIEKKNR